MIVTERAPAKLNLYLHVTGKREDGYHTLDSLVAFADVGDVITVEPHKDHEGLSLSLTGPYAADVPSGPDNLVLKAARLLAERLGVQANAHITLEKNLPVASGIGGGSTDAAATLRALVKFWALKLSDKQIHQAANLIGDDSNTRLTLETLFSSWSDDLCSAQMDDLALRLGADVPVCLEGRTVFMAGIGEQLTLAPPLPSPVWIVLANPHVALSTPSVFNARTDGFSTAQPFYETPKDVQGLVKLLAQRKNDLAAPAIALAPKIQDVLDALNAQNNCLLARMSGSGATCFAIFSSQASALSAQDNLAETQPLWWVKAARIMDSPDAKNWL
ncbi:MAG: 4-(cytidine 5'-diphospho)-2-C-methyl-D-erythritol kinase [Rhodospirillaceae bacterium]|nr:MAG: 4-(cytidine 5'-diphospho)-2-C-methyl-D-erythritol kinase [Rhodospirillaceae bacterium]